MSEREQGLNLKHWGLTWGPGTDKRKPDFLNGRLAWET